MDYLKLVSDFFKLRGNIKKTNAEIKEIQDSKLRSLLKFAYTHSAYYREAFEKAGITEENLLTLPLSAFPTIDKETLMENFDILVTSKDLNQEELRRFDADESEQQKTFKEKYHIVHSSGSTGKPGFFVYDEDAWGQMLLGIIRAALWDMSTFQIIMLLISKPKIAYIAATDGRYGGAMAVGGGVEGLKMQQMFLDIKTPLSQWISSITTFRPNIIIGYPSAIKILAELVESGQVSVSIQRVISCGEPLGGSMRLYLEKVFGAAVINIYGASESLALGVESGNGSGMYLFDDMNYIEALDGAMYLTSLYNRVQPLIRYKISDKLVLKEADENNVYPFTMADNIVGRNEDLLWFSDKEGKRDFLHPLAIEGFCIDGLIDYQFRKLSESSFEMIAEVPDITRHSSIKEEMQRNMGTILMEKNLNYVSFTIGFVDLISVNQNIGKKQLIVPAKVVAEDVPPTIRKPLFITT